MIRLDTTHAPLILIRFVRDVHCDELGLFFRSHEGLLESTTPHGLVVDLDHAGSEESTYDCLCRLFSWFRRHRDTMRQSCRACAFLASSNSFRRIVESLQDQGPPAVPTRIFETADQTIRWLRPLFKMEDPYVFDPAEQRSEDSTVGESETVPSPESTAAETEHTGIGNPSSSPAMLRTSDTATAGSRHEGRWSPYHSGPGRSAQR